MNDTSPIYPLTREHIARAVDAGLFLGGDRIHMRHEVELDGDFEIERDVYVLEIRRRLPSGTAAVQRTIDAWKLTLSRCDEIWLEFIDALRMLKAGPPSPPREDL